MRLLKYIFFTFLLATLSNQAYAQTSLEIWEIQSDGISSPYQDSLVVTNGNIVTLVTDDRFFIQTPSERSDNDDQTSDGIMVYVGNPPPVQAGDYVTVTGFVQEYFELTEFGPDQLTYTIDSSGAPLPAPFLLDETIPAGEIQMIPDLEKLEGMRVQFSQAVATGPQVNELVPLSLKPERAFREPGIEYPGINGLPVWDGNTEVFQLNTTWSTGAAYSAGMIASATGVLTFSNGSYQVIPNEMEFVGEKKLQAVRDRAEMEATIGSLNCFVFTSTSGDFSIRNSKVANYIIDQLKAPDILAVQEVRDLNTLQLLANKIEEIRPDIQYDAYLELGNQSGSFQINNGFLVRNTIQDVVITQWAADEILSLGGLLHDRPPLLLEGNFATNPPTPIKVLNLHLRSLGGIEGGNSSYVRTKRFEQSVSVANIVRDLEFDNLVIVGDYNAFQFSDGYVDVLAQIAGTLSLGAQFPVVENILTNPLTNHSLSVPLEEQYSYIFEGNAQILDHCLSTELEDITINGMQYARGNSDNPNNDVDIIDVPYRASDHDGFVLFLGLNDSISVSNQDLEHTSFNLNFPNPFYKNALIDFELDQGGDFQITLVDQLGRSLFLKEWKNLQKGKYSFSPDWNLNTGIYYLLAKGEGFQISEKLVWVEH